MDSTIDNTENAPETPELPGDLVSTAVKSALDTAPFQNAAAQAESLSGPAVLAQPPAGETGVPVAQSAVEVRRETAKRDQHSRSCAAASPARRTHSGRDIAASRRPLTSSPTRVHGKPSRLPCLAALSSECSLRDSGCGRGLRARPLGQTARRGEFSGNVLPAIPPEVACPVM
jgi:hypothetical protein